MITNGIKAALTLALLALCAGGVALFYSHLARTEAEESKEELRELERLSEFAERIRDFEGDLREVAGDAGEFFDMLDNIVGQTEDGFRRVAEQRRRMNENLERLADTVRSLEQRLAHLEETTPLPGNNQPEAPEARARPDEEESEPEGPAGERDEDGPRTYQVQTGDTLSGIARDHGVALSALQEANSDVDPLRLQVGQEIVIP